jgi:hypothetical protein
MFQLAMQLSRNGELVLISRRIKGDENLVDVVKELESTRHKLIERRPVHTAF